MGHKEVAKDMLVINPPLTTNQAWNHYTNTFLLKYRDILTGKVKAHKNTTCQMGITVDQKYIWNMKVDNEFQFLREKTKGPFFMDKPLKRY